MPLPEGFVLEGHGQSQGQQEQEKNISLPPGFVLEGQGGSPVQKMNETPPGIGRQLWDATIQSPLTIARAIGDLPRNLYNLPGAVEEAITGRTARLAPSPEAPIPRLLPNIFANRSGFPEGSPEDLAFQKLPVNEQVKMIDASKQGRQGYEGSGYGYGYGAGMFPGVQMMQSPQAQSGTFTPPSTLGNVAEKALDVTGAALQPAGQAISELSGMENVATAPAFAEAQLGKALAASFAAVMGSQAPQSIYQRFQQANASPSVSEYAKATGGSLVDVLAPYLVGRAGASHVESNPSLLNSKQALQESGPAEYRQGDPMLPFLMPEPPKFQGLADLLDRMRKPIRPSQASPVIIGERQPQGSQILTPEMLSQSPTTVTPQYVPSRPPVGDIGGQVSFRGERGIPSAMQSKDFPAPSPTLSRQQIGQDLNLRTHVWSAEAGGAEGYTDPKTGMSIEGVKPGTSGEVVEDRMQAKNEPFSSDEEVGMKERKVGGKVYGGLFFLDPDFWKEQVKVAGDVKMDATQLYNKIRNSLGKDSGAWKATDSDEFKTFMFSAEGGRRSTDEVREWMERNGPKVEVRKFGNYSTNEASRKMSELEHGLDTAGITAEYNEDGDQITGWQYNGKNIRPEDMQSPHAQRMVEMEKLYNGIRNDSTSNVSHWSSIAPKAKSDMPGYVEIAVVKPINENGWKNPQPGEPAREQFPSSHSFPPNTLGFVRGYMETTADGKKVFHVIEVQSDWAQKRRNYSQELADRQAQESGLPGRKAGPADDPLLPHYERLALKAAIDHARSEGADSIAISDAETAMMTEGHDRQVRHNQNDLLSRAVANEGTQVYEFTPNNIRLEDAWKELPSQYKSIIDQKTGEGYKDDKGFVMYTDDGSRYIIKELKTMPQYEGMRLHYDRTLPKIAEELTGEKGKRVEFGENKMAYEEQVVRPRQRPIEGGEIPEVTEQQPRKDLIFRDPSGQPKTSISARQYDISKARENFSFYGSDKPKAPLSASPSTKLYGGLPVFDPDLWMQTASDLKEMKDKLAAHLAKKDVRGEVAAVVEAARKSTLMDSPRAAAILNNPNAKKFETLGKKFAQPGEKVSALTSAQNALKPIFNTLSEGDKVVNPWDVIFDWMDGGKAKFKGPLIQNIRMPFDEKFNIEGNMHKVISSVLDKIVKDNKLRPENEQRIAVYLHSLQEGGRQRMIESGVKPSTIDNIIKTISPAERQYADAWRKLDDELYPQLRDVALKADGVKLKQVANHFPWMRDFDKYTPEVDEIATNPSLKKGSTVEPGDVLWPGLPVDLGARKTPGSILSRQKNAKSPIRFDTFSIAERYIRDATHYISSRELVKDTGKLVHSDEFSDKYGDLGQKLMTEFLNTYARQGRYKKNIWIDTVKRNIGRSIIGGRIPSQLLHTANIPLAMQQAGGPIWWNRGLQASLTEEGQKFINDNFIETKMRGGGEPVQAEIAAQQARTMVGKRFNDVSRWSFAVQRELDRLNAQATTMAVYMRLLKESGKEPNDYANLPIDSKLIGEARIRARRAVASPIYKDTPPIVGRGGSLGRSFFQFQNVFLDQYSNLRYEGAQVGLPNAIRGNPRQLMTTTAALLGMLIIETSIKHGYKKVVNVVADKEPNKDDDKFTTELAEEALKRAPGMGQLQSDLLYGGIGVPTLDVPLDTLKEGKKFLQGDRNERITSATRAAVDVSELFGIPLTSQIGDGALAVERRLLYKSHDKRVSKLAGRDVSSMSLQDRIKAEKSYKATEQPMSKDDQAKAAERNIANITKRGQEITKELSPASRKWIQSKNLGDAVPGFDNKLKVGGANVYLTSEESDRLGELVKGEYEKTISQLQTQKSEISKEVFNEQLAFARARARSVMMGELDKEGKKQSQSQLSRSDSEQDQPSRFSIIPRN